MYRLIYHKGAFLFSDFLKGPYRRVGIIGIASIAIMIIIFCIAIPLVQFFNRPAYLDILIAPIDATVSIDDANYRSATYEFIPGNYHATISKDGYKTKEFDIEVKRGETSSLYTYLAPQDGNYQAFEMLKNRSSLKALLKMNGYNEDGQKLDNPSIIMSDSDSSADGFIKKVTIGSEMPIFISICGTPAKRANCNAISINYDYACNNQLCLNITGRGRNLDDSALNEIKTKIESTGRNFSDYRYTYEQNLNI